MSGGWIKLYRDIQDHWIWQNPQKLKWWLDIILLANYQDNKFLLGNDLMLVERGQFHTSEIKLSERWGVDRKTVRKFLDLLQNDGMISVEKSRQIGTTIKVSNYNGYQAILPSLKDNKRDNALDNGEDNKMDNDVDITKKEKNYKKDKEREEEEEKTISLPSLSDLNGFRKVFINQFGEVAYRTWLEPCEIKETDYGVLIKTPNSFIKQIFESKYKKIMALLYKKKIEVAE